MKVDHWIDHANLIVNGPGLEAICAGIDEYLSLRVFLAGHQLSAGDIACWAQLAGKPSLPHPKFRIHYCIIHLPHPRVGATSRLTGRMTGIRMLKGI